MTLPYSTIVAGLIVATVLGILSWRISQHVVTGWAGFLGGCIGWFAMEYIRAWRNRP